MKQLIQFSPVFTPANKKLDFSAYPNFDIRCLYVVFNCTRNVVMYAQGTPAVGASAINGAVITLIQDTTQFSPTDVLAVLYDPQIFTPAMSSGGNKNITTAATGANFTTLPAQPCKQVTVVNNTPVTLEVQQDAAGDAFPVLPGTSFTFFGLVNASEIGIRRFDQSNTPVTVNTRWES